MRSAVELAQDSIPSPASSTNPSVPAFRISPQVTLGSICSDRNLIFEGIRGVAVLAENAGGLVNERRRSMTPAATSKVPALGHWLRRSP